MAKTESDTSAAAHIAPEHLTALQAALGHTFAHPQLLVDALTHRSYLNEFGGPHIVSNERLEFLGDAVLALVSATLLYGEFPDAPEGELSQLRAALVRASTLANFARRLEIGPAMRFGRSEETRAGVRESLLASAFEAVLGALYLDAGITEATRFLAPLLRDEMTQAIAQRRIKDAKSRFQELAQARLGVTPRYRTASESGPAHERTFVVEVLLDDLVVARGEGHSKQQAEQAAAQNALQDKGWSDADD